MRIDKVVLRSIVSTLAGIAVLSVALVAILSFVFPSTMMHFTYDLGMEGASVFFAKSAYKQSGDVYYIAFACETAIGESDTENIEYCGSRLVEDDGFEAYCDARDEKLNGDGIYKNYVYAHLCLAKYDLGEPSLATDMAISVTGNTFPSANPMATLLVYSMSKADSNTVQILYDAMTSLVVPVEHQTYLQNLTVLANEYLSAL